MSQVTLPRLAWKRRDVAAEAVIPCATARVAPAAHLAADDRRREPTFDDLIARNKREPSHQDLLDVADNTPEPSNRSVQREYPGVSAAALALMRAEDRRADHDEHAYDVEHLIPAGQLATVPLRAEPTEEWELALLAPPAKPVPAVEDTAEHDAIEDALMDGYEKWRDAEDAAFESALATDALVVDDTDTVIAVPATDWRLLSTALDALDQLPTQHDTDGGSFQFATNAAAVLTYAALRPDLLARLDVTMMLAPALAELTEVTR